MLESRGSEPADPLRSANRMPICAPDRRANTVVSVAASNALGTCVTSPRIRNCGYQTIDGASIVSRQSLAPWL